MLTDELYELGLNSNKLYLPLNDKYCLVTKAMPVTDEMLEEYIANIRKCKKLGINIASILDYRFIPGTTSNYGENINYSKGVYLEERAKGKSFNSEIIYAKLSDNIEDIINTYLIKTNEYLEELELRSKASQEIYDKLIRDYLEIEKNNLVVDPKPTNFYFSEDEGYTFIDLIGNNNYDNSEFFPRYIMGIVYGYDRPFVFMGNDTFYGLPKEYQDRFIIAYEESLNKIVNAFKKYKIKEEYYEIEVNRRLGYVKNVTKEIVSLEEMPSILEDIRKRNTMKM